MTISILIPCRQLFPLGAIVATPGALEATTDDQRLRFLSLHAAGDWGCVGDEDWQTNDEALQEGERILSAYAIDAAKPCKGFGDNTLWIITERDRSVTTFLLPSEY
jgi:hypothetical protein